MNTQNVTPEGLPVNPMGAPPANDIDAIGPDDLAAWQRAWNLLPEVHRRALLNVAHAVNVLATTPRRRRSSVRAPAPTEVIDPAAMRDAQALLRRHTVSAR